LGIRKNYFNLPQSNILENVMKHYQMTLLSLFIGLLFVLFSGCNKDSATEPAKDTEKPTVSILFPASGSDVKADTTYTVIADANDNIKVTKVDFYINGQNVGSDSLSPYEYRWNTQGLTGSPTIMAKAFDDAGNIGTSSVLTVTINGHAIQVMIHVTGGTFTIGSTNVLDNAATPPHSVTLGSFYIDTYEVTYEKWTEVRNWGLTHGYIDLYVGQNGSDISGVPSNDTNNPVTYMNWYDIVKWCNARSEKEGFNSVYYTDNTLATVYRTGQLDLASDAVKWTANGYRLPTEAEWEFAACGGNLTHGYSYSGSNTIGDVAWYGNNSGNTTHTIGTKQSNELGIYDMSGNAIEWCWDWFALYSGNAQTDPKGATSGIYRVLRGGYFDTWDRNCRVASRSNGYDSNVRRYCSGFRCVQK
jgi:formylglycine-generating enzyme required for sulfatase activity